MKMYLLERDLCRGSDFAKSIGVKGPMYPKPTLDTRRNLALWT